MAEPEGLVRDLKALRRHLWFPILAVVVALGVAGGIGLTSSPSDEAAFRSRVSFSALPPLFGPPTLPTSADLARFATGPEVLERAAQLAAEQGVEVAPDALAGRLAAEGRADQGRIEFTVRDPDGDRALAIARAWQAAFEETVQKRAPDLEGQATADYETQLSVAAAVLAEKQQAAVREPADPAAQAELDAAEENYVIASRLEQAYEVVARTLKVDVVVERGPHLKGGGSLDWAGRLGAAAAFGLVVGVLGALALEALARRGVGAGRTAPGAAERPRSPAP